MKIWVNGAETELEAATLATALAELGYGNATVATALNGDFVPKTERATCALCPGDRIEIVAPLQGG